MSLIEWRDEFSIGLPEVDFEHRALIADINQLHGEIGADASATGVAGRLGQVQAAIAAHFALEEKSMAALRYDGYTTHKADHERLLDEILDIQDSVLAAGQYDPAALAGALQRWFGEHFRTHDAQLHRWLVVRQT